MESIYLILQFRGDYERLGFLVVSLGRSLTCLSSWVKFCKDVLILDTEDLSKVLFLVMKQGSHCIEEWLVKILVINML